MRQLKTRGLTLVELLTAMAVMAMLLTAGVPAAVDYVANARLREAGTVVLADALFAQSESVKRNGPVQLRVAGRDVQVVDRSQAAPQVLRTRRLPEGVATGGDETLAFGSSGRPEPWGTEYAVRIVPQSGACSGNHRCPVVHVYAGGAANLCIEGESC